MRKKISAESNSAQAELTAKIKAYEKQKKEYAKQRDKARRERDKEYAKQLKQYSAMGLYNPKGTELTPYRKKRLREITYRHKDVLQDNKYFFVPANGAARQRILERARSLEMQTSKTGIFFPKEGHKTAKLKHSKKHDEWFIERRGKTKSGVNKGRNYRDVVPLTSLDELDRERARLTKMAKRLGPIDWDNGERLSFKVVENGMDGYSHSTFDTIERLLKYLDDYKKKDASKVNFFRHVTIEKTTVNEWFQLHRPRSPGKKERRKITNRFDTRSSKG